MEIVFLTILIIYSISLIDLFSGLTSAIWLFGHLSHFIPDLFIFEA